MFYAKQFVVVFFIFFRLIQFIHSSLLLRSFIFVSVLFDCKQLRCHSKIVLFHSERSHHHTINFNCFFRSSTAISFQFNSNSIRSSRTVNKINFITANNVDNHCKRENAANEIFEREKKVCLWAFLTIKRFMSCHCHRQHYVCDDRTSKR